MIELAGRLKRFLGVDKSQGAILIFHRVIDLQLDPQLLCVSSQNFDTQLLTIAEEFSPLSLAEFVDRLRNRSLPRKSVAITFDDGYADNLEIALPLLEKYRLPATFFIATGTLNSNREFYWDELERLLLNSGQNIQLPRCLLELIGNSKLLRRLAITQESQDRDWDVTQQPQCIWQFAYRCACESLKSCHEIKRQSFLERIRSELDVDAQGRDSHRCLSREELRQFARHPLVTIGGHTVTHPQLSVLTSLDQRKELSQNLETLEGLTGKRPWAFAYPYGSQSDYTHVTVEQVRALGYQAAFSNSLLPVERMPSEYEVPRRLVRNWDVSSFRKRLNEWLL